MLGVGFSCVDVLSWLSHEIIPFNFNTIRHLGRETEAQPTSSDIFSCVEVLSWLRHELI